MRAGHHRRDLLMDEGIGLLLQRIGNDVAEVRGKLDVLVERLGHKADTGEMKAVTLRVGVMETDNTANKAVSNALESLKMSRRAIWLAIGLAAVSWSLTLISWLLIK